MKNIIRLFVLCSVCCILNSRVYAAKNPCVFKVSAAAYADLVGDTDVTVTAMDSFYTITALAGNVYPFFGNNWVFDNTNRAISIMGTGRIYVGIDTGFALFDGLYADTMELIDPTSKISYKTEGTAGQKILKVQWKNMKIWSGPASNYINVQVWMYQATGVVEFHYGPRSASNASGYSNPVTGIYAGIWYSNPGYTKVYEKINIKDTPPAIKVDSVLSISVPNIQGVPDSGTVYRFIPKVAVTSIPTLIPQQVFHIAPNPSDKEIVIRLQPSIDNTAVQLVDVNGRPVKQNNIPAGSTKYTLTVDDVPAGTYQLRFQNRDAVTMQKIVVVH